MTSEANKTKLAKHQVKIGGMQCSFCTESVRKALSRLEGVEKVNVSLAHEEALVYYDQARVEPWQIDETFRSLGFLVRDPKRLRSFEEEEDELRHERNRLLISASLTLGAVGPLMGAWMGAQMPGLAFIMIYLALTNVFIVGYPILRMAYHSLRRGILNQHVLMELGAFGGLAGGFAGFLLPQFKVAMADFFAVAVFITAYHILGGYASLRVRTKSSQAVKKLLALQPPTARVIRDGREMVVVVEEVRKEELVRIRPGESIPIDGVVVEGYSTVDESLVTGESIPTEKTVGSEVIGGSVNLTGTLKVRVMRIGEESFLQQVARYIEEARALKPGILQLIDILLKYFVPGVLFFSALGFLAWSVGAGLFLGQPNIPRAAFAALAVLVMGYPCALGMATPLAMIRGGGMAAQKGILFRSAEAFHVFRDVKKVVFDKTGTITKGKPYVVEVAPLNNHGVGELLWVAASAEGLSEHPLARAIVERALEEGAGASEAVDFQSVPGKGVRAKLKGKPVLVGSVRLLAEEGINLSPALEKAKRMEEDGETVVGVSYGGELMGLIGIADQVKGEAAEVIAGLRGLGIEPIMLTGDNERTAKAVARTVGIDHVIAHVLPNEKAEVVRRLQEGGHRVVMVGDGINDAPSLMQADIGIAIGAGTDIAIESADVIIIGDRLSAVLDAYFICRSSYGKTKQNLALAFSFNVIGVPAATTGLVHPIWAMVAMGLSVTGVITNSFGGRLIPKPKRKEQIKELALKVPSIRCQGCLTAILEAVSDVEGVVSAEGDYSQKLVVVSYRGGIEVEGLIRREVVKKGHIVT